MSNIYKHVNFKDKELTTIISTSLIVSLLFWIMYLRLTGSNSYQFSVFIFFSIFIFFLFLIRFFLMKYFAYYKGIELEITEAKFNKFGLRTWDSISYWSKGTKGIPLSIVSIFLYFLTIGIFVYPFMYRIKKKIIPHMHIGSNMYYEGDFPIQNFEDVTYYRLSYPYFYSLIYYFIVVFIFKIIIDNFSLSNFYYWPLAITLYIGILSMIPIFIFSQEGFELFFGNKVAWYSALTILVWGSLFIFIFDKIFYFFITLLVFFILTFFTLLYRKWI